MDTGGSGGAIAAQRVALLVLVALLRGCDGSLHFLTRSDTVVGWLREGRVRGKGGEQERDGPRGAREVERKKEKGERWERACVSERGRGNGEERVSEW